MALPSTGSISMSQVRTELGRNNTITLNDSDVRSLAGRTSGTISMSDLRGKSSYTHILTPGSKTSGVYGYYNGGGAGKLTPSTLAGMSIASMIANIELGGVVIFFTNATKKYNGVYLTVNNITANVPSYFFGDGILSCMNGETASDISIGKAIASYLKSNLGKAIKITLKLY